MAHTPVGHDILGLAGRQKCNVGVAIVARIQLREAIMRKCLALGGFDHQQRVRRKPTAVAQTFQRRLDQSLAIGRIEKDQIEWPAAPAPNGPRSVASRRQILVTPVKPSASTFSRWSARLSASLSTSRQKRAPRDSASMPSAPVPANRSATAAFSTVNPMLKSRWSRILKIAWRVRSEVGRTSWFSGATNRRPPNFPPVTLMPTLPFAVLT